MHQRNVYKKIGQPLRGSPIFLSCSLYSSITSLLPESYHQESEH